MKIAKDITETIGNTPIIKLNRITDHCFGEVWVKLEYFNPGSSVKCRVAREMIEAAEKAGAIQPGATLIEATSGNTGIGLAMVSAAKGYKMVIVMPESMSIERRKLFAHLGAELVLTPAAEGMAGSIRRAEEINQNTPGSLMMRQFENPNNVHAHELYTAQEILADTEGKIDFLVAGVGTGGTISGNAKVLKAAIPNLQVIAVEPAGSPVLSGKAPGKHMIQGIGAGFVPKNYNPDLVDAVYTVTDEDALQTARRLAAMEGILCGISAGANVAAALRLAQSPTTEGKVILTFAPDTAERYISTALFE